MELASQVFLMFLGLIFLGLIFWGLLAGLVSTWLEQRKWDKKKG